MTYQYRTEYSAPDLVIPVVPALINPAKGAYRRFIKRVLDVLLVLIVALPVLVVVLPLALLVMLDGKSPFFVQDRVGHKGRVFRMVKLRTMIANADTALDAYLASDPAARAEWDLHQKLHDDPRITPVGNLLRKTSLDELPQFWNVLIGDMSIVGPRPMMVSQKAIYPGTEYYAMRPGITGFWQISDRNESSFSERANFDRSYYLLLSLPTDLWVMIKTVGVVLRGTGY